MGDSVKEKRDVLTFRPDIEFERRKVTGDGDILAGKDPSDRSGIRRQQTEKENAARRRRLDRINFLDKKFDAIEQRILDNLSDFSITFDPTKRPGLAQAVDTLMREDGPTPTRDAAKKAAAQQFPGDPEEDTIIRSLEEQPETEPGTVDTSEIPEPPSLDITAECYQRATTLLMDSIYHAQGIDPVSLGMANTGDGPPMVVPPPSEKPKNCGEMADMKNVDLSPDAALVPADQVIEQRQQTTLMDLLLILWQMILYFVYGFIISMLRRMKLTKIPFGVGKKVKRFIRYLKREREDILCAITGDCPDEDEEEDPYIPNPNDGFEEVNTMGNETWSGMECLAAAKKVSDFVADQVATTPMNPSKDSAGSGSSKDSAGSDVKINGKPHLLPVLNAVQQSRDRFESLKFATVMEIPSTEKEFDKDIEEVETKSASRPRYGNRFYSRTSQGWRDMR